MMYPFMTLDDSAEIVHSEMRPDGTVKVYVEKPDEKIKAAEELCGVVARV